MHTELRPHHMTSELLKVILQNFNKYIILSEQQEKLSTYFFLIHKLYIQVVRHMTSRRHLLVLTEMQKMSTEYKKILRSLNIYISPVRHLKCSHVFAATSIMGRQYINKTKEQHTYYTGLNEVKWCSECTNKPQETGREHYQKVSILEQ